MVKTVEFSFEMAVKPYMHLIINAPILYRFFIGSQGEWLTLGQK